MGEAPHVLVLGGSNFMGRETVLALLAAPAQVHVVNRGRRHWGTTDFTGGRVNHVVADRRMTWSFARCLDTLTEEVCGRWALVADFSAFTGRDVSAALTGLRGRFDRYVYISSDSVYEVSNWAALGWKLAESSGLSPFVSEAQAARPGDMASRWQLWWEDSYGHEKLEAEEILAESVTCDSSSSFAVALRLPDVVGPYDDTLRIWAYWHWLQRGDPVHVEPDDQRPLAFVFSKDVARFIAGLLHTRSLPGAQKFDAVNLACVQQPTLSELLRLLAAASGLPAPLLLQSENAETFLPSVGRPWKLCCERAAGKYKFVPTPLEQALRITCAWLSQANSDFPEESSEAFSMLPNPHDGPGSGEVCTESDASSSEELGCWGKQ